MAVERDRNTYRVYENIPSSPGLIFRAHAFTIIENGERKLITSGHVISIIPENNSLIFVSNDNQERITNPKFFPRSRWGNVVEATVDGEGGFEIAKKVEDNSQAYIYSPNYFFNLKQLKLSKFRHHKLVYKSLESKQATFKGSSGSPIFDSDEKIIGIHDRGNNKTKKYTGWGWKIKNKATK